MKLENQFLEVVIGLRGAQIDSLKRKDLPFEYMWQKDPKFWAYSSPTLFPIVGATFDHQIRINGQTFKMKRHGFARNFDFECISHSEKTCTLRLVENEETLSQYPYKFILDVTYTLVDEELKIDYRITNNSEEVMPYQFGLHPAFNLCLEEGEQVEDYFVSFSPKSDLTFYNEEVTLYNVSELPLSEEMFEERPTWMFENVITPRISVGNGRHGVEVIAPSYRWLALWKLPRAKYLCIEPWFGHGDFEPLNIELKDREGTMLLEKNRSWMTSYSIRPY